MIEITSHSLHARWFLLWDRCFAKFGSGKSCLVEGRTNLCTYFWVSVGAPVLIGAIHAAVLAVLGYSLLYYPTVRLGVVGYLVEISVVGAVGCVWWAIASAVRWANERPSKLKTIKAPKPTRSRPSLFSLLWQYIVATKQRFCPLIRIEG